MQPSSWRRAPPPSRPPPKALFAAGAIAFVAAGGFVVAVGAGWVPSSAGAPSVPGWLVSLMGLAFVAGGTLLFAEGYGHRDRWSVPLGLAVTACLLIVVHWIAFGPGDRQFTSATGVSGSVSPRTPISESEGRFWFGAFAIVLDLIVLGALIHRWRRRGSSADRA